MYIRFRSSERWEKKLPKPLYVLLAIVSLVIILGVGALLLWIVSTIGKRTDYILDAYVEMTGADEGAE